MRFGFSNLARFGLTLCVVAVMATLMQLAYVTGFRPVEYTVDSPAFPWLVGARGTADLQPQLYCESPADFVLTQVDSDAQPLRAAKETTPLSTRYTLTADLLAAGHYVLTGDNNPMCILIGESGSLQMAPTQALQGAMAILLLVVAALLNILVIMIWWWPRS